VLRSRSQEGGGKYSASIIQKGSRQYRATECMMRPGGEKKQKGNLADAAKRKNLPGEKK